MVSSAASRPPHMTEATYDGILDVVASRADLPSPDVDVLDVVCRTIDCCGGCRRWRDLHRSTWPPPVVRGNVLTPPSSRPLCSRRRCVVAELEQVVARHGLHLHMYADDCQVYLSTSVDDAPLAVDRFTACVVDVNTWLSMNRLKLNAAKTQLMWLGLSPLLGARRARRCLRICSRPWRRHRPRAVADSAWRSRLPVWLLPATSASTNSPFAVHTCY